MLKKKKTAILQINHLNYLIVKFLRLVYENNKHKTIDRIETRYLY